MKIFLKLGIFLALTLTSLLGVAESKSARIYDMFSGKDGVITLSFSKSFLEPFELFLDDDTKKVIYQMEKVRFLAYNEDKGKLESEMVYDKIITQLSGSPYFEIDPDDLDCDDCNIHVESDDELTLIGHGTSKKMNEFHALIYDGDDCILFSFYGDISVEDLKQCSKFTQSTKNVISF